MNFEQFFHKIIRESYDDDDTVGVRGEYWFDESGNSMYADGDVGDMGHEAYVIQRCAGEVLDMFDINADMDVGSLENYEDQILETINEDHDFISAYLRIPMEELEETDTMDLLAHDPASVIMKYIETSFRMPEKDASELVLTAYGSTVDARKYAIEKWNWKRVHGSNVESRSLTRDDLRIIASGINNALDEEGFVQDYEDTPEKIDNHVYTISTYTGKRYDITLADMEAGNVEDMERSDLEIRNTAAAQQLRQADLDSGPDYYRNKGIIGDSYKRK